MGRFDWLELGREAKEVPLGRQETFDAADFLQEARRAFRQGAYESALRQYAKALREDPGLEEAWFGQVLSLMELRELHEARTWANKGLESIPESPKLLGAKAVILAMMGDFSDAAALADRAIAKRQPPPVVWLLRGLVFLNLEPPGNAAYCFAKAMESAGEDPFIELWVGMAYVEKEDFARAKGHLDRAVQRDSSNPLAWHALGRCFEGLFAPTRAAACYERALSFQPEFRARALDDLGRLARRGFWERLDDWLRSRLDGRG